MRFDLELERLKRRAELKPSHKKAIDNTIGLVHIQMTEAESFSGYIWHENTKGWSHALSDSFCIFETEIIDFDQITVKLIPQSPKSKSKESYQAFNLSRNRLKAGEVCMHVHDAYVKWMTHEGFAHNATA